MAAPENVNTKQNVSRFDEDVRNSGAYRYTAGSLSAQMANARITSAISSAYRFEGARVLDLGCGDGAYTVEFAALGVSEVLGIDPSPAAIDAANARAERLGLSSKIRFETGNIYELGTLLSEGVFDCIVLRGVLHHLPDPARAIAALSEFKGTLIVLEPNGLNPILKMLEKFSKYHIEHEEQSFSPARIKFWIGNSGLRVSKSNVINLVPMFCPDWMAKTLRVLEPVVERIPILRDISCGQSVIVAHR